MDRQGKILIILLESGDKIILHLWMTGCLLVTAYDYPQEKHTHIIFHLSNESELRFSDIRRFGRFWYIQKNEADTYSGISRLGLEPFDKNLSAEYLETKFGRSKKTVKECLLDQSVVAGIGNIYSDEILFRAKVCPVGSTCEVMSALFVVKYFAAQSLAAGAASIVQSASRTCHDDCWGDII